jgi:hypothetical protein
LKIRGFPKYAAKSLPELSGGIFSSPAPLPLNAELAGKLSDRLAREQRVLRFHHLLEGANPNRWVFSYLAEDEIPHFGFA